VGDVIIAHPCLQLSVQLYEHQLLLRALTGLFRALTSEAQRVGLTVVALWSRATQHIRNMRIVNIAAVLPDARSLLTRESEYFLAPREFAQMMGELDEFSGAPDGSITALIVDVYLAFICRTVVPRIGEWFKYDHGYYTRYGDRHDHLLGRFVEYLLTVGATSINWARVPDITGIQGPRGRPLVEWARKLLSVSAQELDRCVFVLSCNAPSHSPVFSAFKSGEVKYAYLEELVGLPKSQQAVICRYWDIAGLPELWKSVKKHFDEAGDVKTLHSAMMSTMNHLRNSNRLDQSILTDAHARLVVKLNWETMALRDLANSRREILQFLRSRDVPQARASLKLMQSSVLAHFVVGKSFQSITELLQTLQDHVEEMKNRIEDAFSRGSRDLLIRHVCGDVTGPIDWTTERFIVEVREIVIRVLAGSHRLRRPCATAIKTGPNSWLMVSCASFAQLSKPQSVLFSGGWVCSRQRLIKQSRPFLT
jgi:hypothetical protein